LGESENALLAAPDNLPGREKRNQNLSTKLTEAEARSIEEAALKSGKSPSEWAREVLLKGVQSGTADSIQVHIFTELVAIELAIMNGLEPLLRGEKLTHEQAVQLFRQVQATKSTRAQEILLKRVEQKEK
jgi:hypothetical protein